MIAEISNGLRTFRCWVADANKLPLHGFVNVKNHLFIEIFLFLSRQGKHIKFLQVLIKQLLQLPSKILDKFLHGA